MMCDWMRMSWHFALCYTYPDRYPNPWWDEATALSARMAEGFEAATTQASKLRTQSWNDWCDQALNGSANMMHNITSLQQVWNPSVVERAPGIFSSCPDE
eukprot:6891462-Pyramimonas_sp.AAC.1